MFNLRPPGQKPLLGTSLDWNHPLSEGLIGCWVMNEGAGNKIYDLSGSGIHGVITGGIWVGQGINFNGSSDFISAGNALGGSVRTVFSRFLLADVASRHSIALFQLQSLMDS